MQHVPDQVAPELEQVGLLEQLWVKVESRPVSVYAVPPSVSVDTVLELLEYLATLRYVPPSGAIHLDEVRETIQRARNAHRSGDHVAAAEAMDTILRDFTPLVEVLAEWRDVLGQSGREEFIHCVEDVPLTNRLSFAKIHGIASSSTVDNIVSRLEESGLVQSTGRVVGATPTLAKINQILKPITAAVRHRTTSGLTLVDVAFAYHGATKPAILHWLAQHPAPLRVTDLAGATGQVRETVGGEVANLEQIGLLTRVSGDIPLQSHPVALRDIGASASVALLADVAARRIGPQITAVGCLRVLALDPAAAVLGRVIDGPLSRADFVLSKSDAAARDALADAGMITHHSGHWRASPCAMAAWALLGVGPVPVAPDERARRADVLSGSSVAREVLMLLTAESVPHLGHTARDLAALVNTDAHNMSKVLSALAQCGWVEAVPGLPVPSPRLERRDGIQWRCTRDAAPLFRALLQFDGTAFPASGGQRGYSGLGEG